MNFLLICQQLREEAGISGSGPASTVGQTGILSRVVTAVSDAWVRIQDEPHDWKWMWKRDGTAETLANTDEYVIAQDVDIVHPKTGKIYLKATGLSDISRMVYMEWEEFDQRYGTLQTATTSRPSVFTLLPDGQLKVYPKPDDVYTITFEYQQNAQILVDSADIPEMPEQYHALIKHEAMIVFAGTEDAPELVQPAQFAGQALWKSLHWKQRLKLKEQLVVIPE